MSRKTIVITGASDGIGAAAAHRLSARGERVVLVGRSEAKTAALAAELDVPHHLADYSQLAQVRDLAATLEASYAHIDVLVNNAGGIMGDRTLTDDGFEQTFQVNHLAPFLLTHLLMPTLLASSAKVVQTSSSAAKKFGNLDVEDLQNANRYSPNKAYGDAKLANILFTTELDRRYRARGLAAAAFHPGNVATSFASDTTSWFRFIYTTPLKRIALISPEKGADTLIWLVEGTPGEHWQPGGFYKKRKPATSSSQSTDPVLAQHLWERSVELLSL